MRLSVLILAAGQGKRMKSSLPKVLHCLGGKAMIHHVVDAAATLSPCQRIVVRAAHLDPEGVSAGRPIDFALQETPKGTGDAVRAGLTVLHPDANHVLVLLADVPLITPQMLGSLLDHHRQHVNAITIVGMRSDDTAYGRILRDEQSRVCAIVEYKDASPEERQETLCNSGMMIFPVHILKECLPLLTTHNASNEYYLTDVIALAAQRGVPSYVFEAPADMLQGVNDRVQLATAETKLQKRWREEKMRDGVTMIDPASVFLYHDTVIGQDTIIYPQVTFGPEVVIEENVTIYPHCRLVKTRLECGAKVGPFAHLRDGVVLQEKAEVGNFVEVKKSTFAAGAKAKHLSYIGDATIGVKANIGAGTITCNYNGFLKAPTTIGDGAFVGSNTSLVAPVTVGDGAIIAAGSVVSGVVPANGLAITRAPSVIKAEWARRFRQQHQQKLTKE